MNPFEFVIAIIAMSFLFSLLGSYIRQKHKSGEDKERRSENAELLERLHRAEERIRVLERIVTDERYDLKKQFDDLGR